MQTERCPRCKSRDVGGGKQDLGNDTLYDFACRSCRLFESQLRSAPEFARWRARWTDPGSDLRRDLAACLAGTLPISTFHRRLAEADLRITAARDGDRWHPAALRVGERDELWLFVDDDAVTACRRELGEARLGAVAPAMSIAAILAQLPTEVGAIWVDPYDRDPGYVIERDELDEVRRWGRRVVTERALELRGAAALMDASDLAVAVIDGALAMEDAAIVVFTAPDAEQAYRVRVPAGTSIAFVHQSGRELCERLGAAAGVIVNPAGPQTLRISVTKSSLQHDA